MDKELINLGAADAFMQLYYTDGQIKDKISAHIKRDFMKGMAFNNVPVKKLGDLLGRLIVVIFSPENLQLIKSGPSERRKYMDMELCQISRVYYNELGDYYKVIRQRNNLLKTANSSHEKPETLDVWDEQLVLHGNKIYEFRKNFIEDISVISSEIYRNISGNKESLSLVYKPNATNINFSEKLKKNLDRDLYMGSTGIGIHKDDIVINLNGVDIRSFGSQGQQRTASLSMKLAEIELIRDKKNKRPVLLLDDVLSELDESRQRFLLSYIKDIQTVITCTGVEDIVHKIGNENKVSIFKVDNGNILTDT
jgi:DNA replication and repair protein RecF